MANVQKLNVWCQKVLPAVFDDSLSYWESVCKVVDKLNEVIDTANISGTAIEELQEAINELNEEFEKFKASGFNDYYKEQVAEWIKDNLEYVYDTTIKQVFFGLTDDGYFVAYIPESWDDIVFDTGMVYGRSDYGRLILRFDAAGSIDNTYSQTVAQDDAAALKADLDYVMKTLFTNLDEVVEG